METVSAREYVVMTGSLSVYRVVMNAQPDQTPTNPPPLDEVSDLLFYMAGMSYLNTTKAISRPNFDPMRSTL